MDILFKDLPRIKQPRPDIVYGLFKHDISRALRQIFDQCHCEVVNNLYLPFFIVEAKTQDAVYGDAENQCIRGGATLVNGHHQWNRLAADKKHFKDMNADDIQQERKVLVKAAEKTANEVRTLTLLSRHLCFLGMCLANT